MFDIYNHEFDIPTQGFDTSAPGFDTSVQGFDTQNPELGIYTHEQLRNAGYSRRAIAKLQRQRKIVKFARGWYADHAADPDDVRAIAAGGRLTSVSAAARYQLWIPPGQKSQLHIAYHPSRHKPRKPKNACYHRQHFSRNQIRLDIADVLHDVLRCCDQETAAVIIESALNKKVISLSEMNQLLKKGPKKTRNLRLTTLSQSGSETRVRLFLQQHKITATPQVRINQVGYVDLFVNNSIIVECDGRQYHISESTFENDRRRDLTALNNGYRVVRLSYHQIWSDWPQTQQMLLSIIQQKPTPSPRKH